MRCHQARLRCVLGTGLGLSTTAKRGAGVLTLPLGHPGDFPRGLGGLAGVPTCIKMLGITRRTCRG